MIVTTETRSKPIKISVWRRWNQNDARRTRAAVDLVEFTGMVSEMVVTGMRIDVRVQTEWIDGGNVTWMASLNRQIAEGQRVIAGDTIRFCHGVQLDILEGSAVFDMRCYGNYHGEIFGKANRRGIPALFRLLNGNTER